MPARRQQLRKICGFCDLALDILTNFVIIVHAIAAGADIKSVQSLMGHATASFTLDVYAHTSETMMADTASRMQSYYDNLAQRG